MAQIAVRRAATRTFDPWHIVGWLAMLTLGLAMFTAFLYAPTDAFQGITQRIFYIHFPSAILAYSSAFILFVASLGFLIRKTSAWDRWAVSAAELGVVFTTLALVTGSLWGRQIWGAWWVWDARLTTTLILWLVLVGYVMLRSTTSDSPRAPRFAAVLGVLAFVDVPIIHFSVTWWRTMHPTPIVVRPQDGPQLPVEMFISMIVAFIAFGLLYAWLLHQRVALEATRERARALQARLNGGA